MARRFTRQAFHDLVWSRPMTQLAREFALSDVSLHKICRKHDGKTQTLESMVADIAVGLAVLAAAKTQERLRREAAHREWQEEQARREAAARNAWVEERRRKALDGILAELESLDRLRRLVAGLHAEQGPAPEGRVRAFLAWADVELARRSESVSSVGLESRFSTEQLFGDDDGRDFGTHRWR